jgi:hypothetical protein
MQRRHSRRPEMSCPTGAAPQLQDQAWRFPWCRKTMLQKRGRTPWKQIENLEICETMKDVQQNMTKKTHGV